MSLRLRATTTAQIHAELCRLYPEEGCGMLLGHDLGGERRVARAIASANSYADSRTRHYLISPEQFLAAEREARESGLEVVGFYHSHPDHPARPSAFDLEQAWPYYSYVIVSVAGRRAVDTTSWRLSDDRSRFEPEPIDYLRDDGGDPPIGAITGESVR